LLKWTDERYDLQASDAASRSGRAAVWSIVILGVYAVTATWLFKRRTTE
jgi:hypothetical protein